MSANLRLVDGRTVAVKATVSEITDILKPSPFGQRAFDFYEFRLADSTNEVRRIRLSAIIEYGAGAGK